MISRIFKDTRVLLGIWLLMAAVSVMLHMHNFNNWLIYKHVFWHAWDGQNLFAAYPADHYDTNHYGPLFALVIAPFSLIDRLLPQPLGMWVGVSLWHTFLALFMWYAVKDLVKSVNEYTGQRNVNWTQWAFPFIILYSAHELLNALGMSQFNVATAAMIILSFSATLKGKEQWSTLWIVAGTLLKLYGIVGLAFFLFTPHKLKFVKWLAIWCLVLFVAPMPLFGARYVCQQYVEWFVSLSGKTADNNFSEWQNISLLGMVRKIGYAATEGIAPYLDLLKQNNDHPNNGAPSFFPNAANFWVSRWSDLYLIVPSVVVYLATCLKAMVQRRVSGYLLILASTLMLVNLLSTGSENSSYIISMVGMAVWYLAVCQGKVSRLDLGLLVFAFVMTSLSPTDIFPSDVRSQWIRPFALKALPVVLVWLRLSYCMLVPQRGERGAFRQ